MHYMYLILHKSGVAYEITPGGSKADRADLFSYLNHGWQPLRETPFRSGPSDAVNPAILLVLHHPTGVTPDPRSQAIQPAEGR